MKKDYLTSLEFLAVAAPVAFFILTLFLERVMHVPCWTSCEDGPVEDLQAVILFFAAAIGIHFLHKTRGVYPTWARAFFVIGVAGAIYAGLEEISYGQRIFHWVTPQEWDLVNDQHETNLHNTSAWLDQKPRLILEIGVFLGGIVMPILRRFRSHWLPAKWSAVYPSDMLFTTALFAIGIHVYHIIAEVMNRADMFLIERGSEMQETYLFWFVLLYFMTKKRDIRA